MSCRQIWATWEESTPAYTPPILPNHHSVRGLRISKLQVTSLNKIKPSIKLLTSAMSNFTQFGKSCMPSSHTKLSYLVNIVTTYVERLRAGYNDFETLRRVPLHLRLRLHAVDSTRMCARSPITLRNFLRVSDGDDCFRDWRSNVYFDVNRRLCCIGSSAIES